MVALPQGLIPAPRLKPAIRLAQAVSEYEADLTGDQKAQFNHHRARASQKPPSIQDVMQLTAEIDEQLSTKFRGRCLGTRTTNFLQSVQQFAALGDTLVGGSQNLVASGVWALVRTSLMLILQFSTYFEKVSSLFMVIGRSAPRYEKLALLYPRSKDLQSFLFEYFGVVVRLCHQMLRFTQKSTIGKIGATLNDADLISFQSQLESWAKEIRDEANYLMAQRIEEQASLVTQIWSRKPSKEVTHQRQMKAYLNALDFCSSYDYMSTWKQLRKAGSTTLFRQFSPYVEWRSRVHSSSLILTGRLGFGKSVLLANIVDDLHLFAQGQNVSVAFFFCRHDMPASLRPRTIIGSLARQLLWRAPRLQETSEAYNLNDDLDEYASIRRLLDGTLSPSFRAFLVIDGLDECEVADRQVVLQELRWLQQKFSVLLCQSVRKEPRDPHGIDPEWEELADPLIAAIPDNSSDIEAFIETELEDRIKSGKLTMRDPLLVLEIQDALLKGSQGMFLWVALQIDNLCAMGTDESIRQALADLPQTLSGTFSRILRRVDDSSIAKSNQRRILELIVAARYPLTLDELREALSVVPGDTVWDSAKLINDIFATLACCGSLLTLDEEENTVRLVHGSVRQFLIGPESTNESKFTFHEAHKRMTDTIVTYLNYGIFETQVSTRVIPQLQSSSAPAAIIRSNLAVPSAARELALNLLKLRRTPGFNMGKTMAQYRPRPETVSNHDFRFLTYAKCNCLYHILCTLQTASEASNPDDLLLRLLNGPILDLEKSDEINKLLLLAAERGIEPIVTLLLHSGKINPNTADSSGRTPLHLAASSGHDAIVKNLVDSEKVDAGIADEKGQNALHVASLNGHDSTVRLLLESGVVNINATDHFDQTPLHLALQRSSNKSTAKTILSFPSAKLDLQDSEGQTPLHRAIAYGNTEAAAILLKSGKVNLNAQDKLGQTPLHIAALTLGTELVAKELIGLESTDPNLLDYNMGTPLHRAVKSANIPVMRILLDSKRLHQPFEIHGHGINSKTRTIMHVAAQHGNIGVTKTLLEYEGVDCNGTDTYGKTPLHYAARRGNAGFVKVMLQSDGIRPDIQDNYGRTPLHAAVMHEHNYIADLLMASGKIRGDEVDEDGLTAFDYKAILNNLTSGPGSATSREAIISARRRREQEEFVVSP
ncbi:hypothetical protein N7468_009435 [Penicillium chermesinum]|uniref:NACHT domain-containing protein n=1 Tax=Penicillium chermesinum TaxID=63820 RepID=A0A9W9NHS6_9EURO|nr:uncharacterized protein N7468_009435 [Penicillium chermesinum]KAJ5220231.1 hypothetical protein N7468_009435 [Penicillium chermesinum]